MVFKECIDRLVFIFRRFEDIKIIFILYDINFVIIIGIVGVKRKLRKFEGVFDECSRIEIIW